MGREYFVDMNVESKFETVGQAYAVFSVRELRQMLKDATKGAHARGLHRNRAGQHCIVIHAPLQKEIGAADQDLQFATHAGTILGNAA